MNRIEDQARQIAEPFLEKHGCKLWDVVFEKEGALHYLRILFDGGNDGNSALDMQKCEELTPPLNKLMDKQKFIKEVDILEIGSPGITRRLRHEKHFESCIDKPVRIMRRTDNGKTETIIGILQNYSAENKSIVLKSTKLEEKQVMILSLKKCIRINLEALTEVAIPSLDTAEGTQ
ncbi:MAG: hypothetical protein FWF76_06280 [Oscillospiraceae bacterium]|nr:hypothetical protein [Oscillospiraceae bacterium]